MDAYRPESQQEPPLIIENYRGPLLWMPTDIPANTDLIAEQRTARQPDTRVYPQWSRWGGLAGMVGGLLWVILWIMEVANFSTFDRITIFGLNINNYLSLLIVPIILLLVTMVCFHAVQRRSYRAIGWIGFVPLFLVYCLVGFDSLSYYYGRATYDWICEIPLIIFAQMFWGLIIMAEGRPPRWAGRSLIATGAIIIPAMFLTAYSMALLGLPWIVIGYAMWRDRNTCDGSAERVSVSHVSGQLHSARRYARSQCKRIPQAGTADRCLPTRRLGNAKGQA
jgi:hypothetical protein